jgi:hypothetical protein
MFLLTAKAGSKYDSIDESQCSRLRKSGFKNGFVRARFDSHPPVSLVSHNDTERYSPAFTTYTATSLADFPGPFFENHRFRQLREPLFNGRYDPIEWSAWPRQDNELRRR